MKILSLPVLLVVFITVSCSGTLEIGIELSPDNTPAPTFTTTSLPPLPSLTPTNQPSRTPTMTASLMPTATRLPGQVVIPISSMADTIPWLPLDKSKSPSVFSVFFNVTIPPFNNVQVRQAFAYAIDREKVIAVAAQYWPEVSPASTVIPPLSLGLDLYGEVGIFYDPVKAKDLLTAAGYSDPSYFPIATLMVNAYGDVAPYARQLMAQMMAEMWKENLGVTVKVQTIHPPEFGEILRSNPPEMYWNGWVEDNGRDPQMLRMIFESGAQYNYGHFSSEQFDKLVSLADISKSPAKRQALYIQADRLVCETEAAVIPLYYTISDMP
jgi:ABC-type transport system substrate-binding protein